MPKSLGERELSDLKVKLATDKMAGIELISSLVKAGQFPPDQVPLLVGTTLTQNRDAQVAKAAQDLLAEAAAAKTQQSELKERADQEKLQAIGEMKTLMTKKSFPPELVLSLLGPTFIDKDSNPEIAKAAKELLAEATAANNYLRASITSAVIRDPEIANFIPARVYLEIESEQQTKQANQIKVELEKNGYIVPRFEIVAFRAPRNYELRYYRQVDGPKADDIVKLLKNLQLEVKSFYLKGYENSTKLRPGHYELWLAAASRSGQDWYGMKELCRMNSLITSSAVNLTIPPAELAFPVIVKPSCLASSAGIYSDSLAKTPQEIVTRARRIWGRFGVSAICEEFVVGRELRVGLVEAKRGSIRIVGTSEWLFGAASPGWGFKTQAIRNNPRVRRSNQVTRKLITLPRRKAEELAAIARVAMNTLDVTGYATVDVRVDPMERVTVLEINANPGLWSGSAIWSKPSFEINIREVVEAALRKPRN